MSANKAYPAERRLAYQLGRVLFAAKRSEEAREVLVYPAEMGSTSATDLLGFMYANGEGVRKDEAEAVRLYHQAADFGNTVAIYNLGVMYENGKGVTKDIAKARSYYQIAADRGDSDAKEALKRLSARPKKK